MNDAITRALEYRYEESNARSLETYPDAIFPVDNAAAIASIALNSKATGKAAPTVGRLLTELEAHWVDEHTSLLFQRSEANGEPADAPRGSGSRRAARLIVTKRGARRLRRE